MLNVLIAIVSDTYEEFVDMSKDRDIEEKIKFIKDFDKLIYTLKTLIRKTD